MRAPRPPLLGIASTMLPADLVDVPLDIRSWTGSPASAWSCSCSTCPSSRREAC